MPRNLLLADDSITIQKVIGITFAGEDFTIVTVDNGEDAVRKARECRPDVILADVVMPKKNGYEVCEAIKNDPDLSHIPVLLLAGTFEAFDEARARAARADGHIAKPFESQALINKVRELLEREAPQASVDRTTPVPGPGERREPSFAPRAHAAWTPESAPATPTRPEVRGPYPSLGLKPSPPQASDSPGIRDELPGRPTSANPAGERAGAPARGAAPEQGKPVDLDWATLGFETDAAARSSSSVARGSQPTGAAPAPRSGVLPTSGAGLKQESVFKPASPARFPSQASTPVGVAPAPPRTARQDAVPPAPLQASPQPTAVAASHPSTELLPFGEPIDLVDLEVEDPDDSEPPASSSPQPDLTTIDDRADRSAGLRAQSVALEPGRDATEHETLSSRPDPLRSGSKPDAGEAMLREALSHASREVIERIAWEVIPTLAETIIREHVERLVKEREK